MSDLQSRGEDLLAWLRWVAVPAVTIIVLLCLFGGAL